MKRTIVEAIVDVMRATGRPMTVAEVYSSILERSLYKFNADAPLHIVRAQLRRHCLGLDFASASPHKAFTMLGDGRYWLVGQDLSPDTQGGDESSGVEAYETQLRQLRDLHEAYVDKARHRILDRLRQLDPTAFERFSRKLLEVHGFEDVEVTRKSRDGGIDGHGRLKMGLTYLNVAFQCKNWRAKGVGRPELAQFRGDIQGKFEQGIFFTTSTFSKEAEAASVQAGAVTIILVDGSAIVDLMIEKGFGVETEYLPVPSYALDLAFEDSVSPTVTQGRPGWSRMAQTRIRSK